KAFITAAPGIQRTKGPHSITLLKHATAGGPAAQAVVDYLKSVGDADNAAVESPLAPEQITALTGAYPFGQGADERFDVAEAKGRLSIGRPGRFARGLTH